MCSNTANLDDCPRGCRQARYCGDECRKKDWPRHQPQCHKPIRKRTYGDTGIPLDVYEANAEGGLAAEEENPRLVPPS
jgi:hypothetical protein